MADRLALPGGVPGLRFANTHTEPVGGIREASVAGTPPRHDSVVRRGPSGRRWRLERKIVALPERDGAAPDRPRHRGRRYLSRSPANPAGIREPLIQDLRLAARAGTLGFPLWWAPWSRGCHRRTFAGRAIEPRAAPVMEAPRMPVLASPDGQRAVPAAHAWSSVRSASPVPPDHVDLSYRKAVGGSAVR